MWKSDTSSWAMLGCMCLCIYSKHDFWKHLWPMGLHRPKCCCTSTKSAVLAWDVWKPPCTTCTAIVRLIVKKGLNNDTIVSANLGCFIQPSRCMCPLASLSCWLGELPLSRHRPSVRCREQSLDMPHVAGRQGEHFGWHKA